MLTDRASGPERSSYSVIRLLQEDVLRDKNVWEINLRSAIQGRRPGPFGLIGGKAPRAELFLPEIVYICENNEYSVYPTSQQIEAIVENFSKQNEILKSS